MWGEVWYFKCVVEEPGRPDTPSLGRAIGTFLYDFIRRPSALEGVHADDLVPAWYDLQHGVIEPVLGSAAKFVRQLGKREKAHSTNATKQH